MANERLNLLLVVDVPDSHNAVFSSRYQILPVSCETERLIKMTLNRSIVLFTLEEKLLLAFKVPLKKTAVL